MNSLKLFDFNDYKSFILARIRALPKQGRGELARISKTTGIHKTTLSQILKGSKDLSLEQAVKLARYLELNRAEAEYFILWVEHARAGSHDLRQHFEKQIEERKLAQAKLVNRVTRSRDLSSEERSIYYSNWIYAAVRNLTAIPGFQTAAALSKRLHISPVYLEKILDFLLTTGLSVTREGRLSPGPQMTHLEAESPLVSRHHGNWRVKAMERHPLLRAEDELAYTAPMTLSKEDVQKVRSILADIVQRVDQIVVPSKSEKLFCLNLDWFEVI